jgi:hypothetical protein
MSRGTSSRARNPRIGTWTQFVRIPLVFASLVILLALPLALVFGRVVRERVAVPLLYLLWFARLVFRRIPQSLLWAAFVLGALLVAARSLIRREQVGWPVRGAETVRRGRVHVWAKRIQWAARRRHAKWYLAQHVAKLAVDALAYREQIAPEHVRQLMRSGELNAPPEVRAYLRVGVVPLSVSARPPERSLLAKLRHCLRRAQDTALDLDLEQMLQFLERQLDVESSPPTGGWT